MSLSPEELTAFVQRLAAEPEHWRSAVRHACETRIYEQIWDEEDVNAWLVCWSEDQDTGFHDHDDAAAAIVVLEGEVREDRMRLSAAPTSRGLGPGTTFSVPPCAIQRVRHAGTGPAVTLHAYSPPLRRTGAYRTGSDGELERVAQPYREELRAPAAALG